MQFKIKGYTLLLLTQQNEVIAHVVITAGKALAAATLQTQRACRANAKIKAEDANDF